MEINFGLTLIENSILQAPYTCIHDENYEDWFTFSFSRIYGIYNSNNFLGTVIILCIVDS
jgi:hypothetical protein